MSGARNDGRLAWLIVGAGAALTLLLIAMVAGFAWRQAQQWSGRRWQQVEAEAAERRRILAEPSAASDEPLPVAQGPAPPDTARPIGAPGDWIGPDDYPPTALRRGFEGRVRVTVAVDRAGSPTGCAVRLSSGHWSLDNATCAAMLNHGRFSAAPRGARVRHWTSPAIRWVLPR